MGTCPACGEAATGESAYCAHCGAHLGAPEVAASGGAAPYPPPATEPPPPPIGPPADAPPAAPAPPPPPLQPPPGAGPSTLVDAPHPGDLAFTLAPVGGRRSGPVPIPVVVVGLVLVVVLVTVLLANIGGRGDDGPATADGPTTTFAPLVTSPTLTDEEFVVDMVAADDNVSPLMVEEEYSCFARSMVTAMGGAAALRAAGISPEQLTETFGLRGEQVPADAIDVFLATNAGCGLDLAEVIFFRPLGIELGGDIALCVAAGLDRAALSRLLAEFFLDPQRSDTSFVPTPELREQFRVVQDSCL